MRGTGVLERIIHSRLRNERVTFGDTANEHPSERSENRSVPTAFGDERVRLHGVGAWVGDDDTNWACPDRLHAERVILSDAIEETANGISCAAARDCDDLAGAKRLREIRLVGGCSRKYGFRIFE
jgi:hypothetical protein